ncbi:nuclear transport factor 2 family protein [Aminobacter sp. BE322]|uniref:nuclear transport factor 2 family protein n=1 Tax=unclassified Aminobacter TaxID=2644704 RepID=UPI003D19DDB6
MRTVSRLVAAAALLVAALASAQGGDVVDRWYEALLQADRAALAGLLADNAEIRLDDVGVTQTKAEFIASMDEWETAVAGAAIRHKVEARDGDVTTVLACYDFPSNEALMRETFTIRGERVVASTQIAIGEDCNGI